jgi:hypothetical protein
VLLAGGGVRVARVAGPITEVERARAGFLVETFGLVSVLMALDFAGADGIGKSAIDPTGSVRRAKGVGL